MRPRIKHVATAFWGTAVMFAFMGTVIGVTFSVANVVGIHPVAAARSVVLKIVWGLAGAVSLFVGLVLIFSALHRCLESILEEV